MRDVRPGIEDAFLSTPNTGTANARFVRMCRSLYIRKVTGRINITQFERACRRLEKLARLRQNTFGRQ